MYLAARLTDKSHVQIGVHIGNRNHATVIHALKQIKDMMEVDEKVRQDVEELMDTLHVSHWNKSPHDAKHRQKKRGLVKKVDDIR